MCAIDWKILNSRMPHLMAPNAAERDSGKAVTGLRGPQI